MRVNSSDRWSFQRLKKSNQGQIFGKRVVVGMLPEPIPVLKGKDAQEFLKYDSRPLSKNELTALEKAEENCRQMKQID